MSRLSTPRKGHGFLAAALSADPGVLLSTERLLLAVGTVMVAILHPAACQYLRAFSASRVSREMLILAVIAGIPLIGFAVTNVGLQQTLLDDHAAQSHYGFMAAFGFAAIGVGVLASLRPDGWWLPAWVAGLLPVILGVVSLAYPETPGSLGTVWAVAVIAWGVVFVGVAELTQDRDNPTLLGGRGIIRPRRSSASLASKTEMQTSAEDEPNTRTPRWLNVLGIVALVPIVLFFALPIFGGGAPGGHVPGQGPGQPGASPSGDNTPPIEGAPEVAVTADQLAFDVDRIELSGGQPAVNVALTSVDTLHDLTVDKVGFHVAADRGETVVGGMQGISFGEPGTYVGYCSVPGHREAGMEIEIVVTAGEH